MERVLTFKMSHTIAVVGSRDFTDRAYMKACLEIVLRDNASITSAISGGCRGADKLGEEVIGELGIPFDRHIEAEWSLYGNAAGPIRNVVVVEACDVLVAFPLGKSKGTRDAIRKARKARKIVYVFDRTAHPDGCPKCYSTLWEDSKKVARCTNPECPYGQEDSLV